MIVYYYKKLIKYTKTIMQHYPENNIVKLTVSVPNTLKQYVEKQAKTNNNTMSEFVTKLIQEAIDKVKYEQAKEAIMHHPTLHSEDNKSSVDIIREMREERTQHIIDTALGHKSDDT